MTGKERLLCVLQGEIPDRVPVSFFVQEIIDHNSFWNSRAAGSGTL
ncbi:hypothetical protein [Oceanispirochaeta crateris]|nr:hypothetical protein [Oceanispirochaeta crateris]